MIQRKQSVFLALIVVVFVLLLFVPVYQIDISASVSAQLSGRLLFIPLLFVPVALMSLIALVALFLYKNRLRQLKLCKIGLGLSVLIAANAIVFPQFFVHGIGREHLHVCNWAYLFPTNIILFALAAFFIKKDEDLVKAADRLR